MTLAVRNSSATVPPDPSLRTAGAHIPEADPAQAVAADPSVIDAERDPLYGDRVHWEYRDEFRPGGYATGIAAAREIVRQRRLSRWQEQR